eukprot:gene5954-15963_t
MRSNGLTVNCCHDCRGCVHEPTRLSFSYEIGSDCLRAYKEEEKWFPIEYTGGTHNPQATDGFVPNRGCLYRGRRGAWVALGLCIPPMSLAFFMGPKYHTSQPTP